MQFTWRIHISKLCWLYSSQTKYCTRKYWGKISYNKIQIKAVGNHNLIQKKLNIHMSIDETTVYSLLSIIIQL